MNVSIRLASCFLFMFITSQFVLGDNWTRFRGPNGQGYSSEKELPVTWSADDNLKWKVSIPGHGWSSPIVYGEHVFVTTTTDDGVSCRVVCVNRQNGEIAWDKEVHRQKTGPMRKQNSYATPTPVTDGKHVYAVFYDGTVVAVDFSGNLVWQNNDVKFFSLHGLGASPILVDGQLIMTL